MSRISLSVRMSLVLAICLSFLLSVDGFESSNIVAGAYIVEFNHDVSDLVCLLCLQVCMSANSVSITAGSSQIWR